MKVTIRQAREHNLKGVDAEFGDGLTVVTGVSGSGKTSLVFDTLYHESRRRFLDIFNLGTSGQRLAPAQVESITGLGPAVAVGQNLLNRNPASILATASGLHPFLRLLYANYGERSCPGCGQALLVYNSDTLIEILKSLARSQSSLAIYAPLVRRARGSHRKLLELLAEQVGPSNLVIDGVPGLWGPLDPGREHDILVRLGLLMGEPASQRLRVILKTAVGLGVQAVVVAELKQDQSFHEQVFPMAPVCPDCGRWFGDLRSAHFLAPCPYCKGSGVQTTGTVCTDCQGTGMHPEAVSVRWNGLRLPELLALSVNQAGRLLREQELPATASRLLTEIQRRLEALKEVGLGYLSLDRSSPTLSRGEAQRVRLAVALTSRLEDMLHVLDEPTVGQHPADVSRLLPVFRKLAGPVVYVEHDRLAAAYADRAIDLGPGAGQAGGEVIFSGTPRELWQADTPSGRWFSGRQRQKSFTSKPDPADGYIRADEHIRSEFLVVCGASLRNLQGFDVSVPVERLTVITGVSGSGKSTLVEDVLVASLNAGTPMGCSRLEGTLLKPVFVDQSPIGINPRSNPATYTGLADIIRDLFAARTGLSPSHFSFNRDTGACPTCKGMGAIEVHMRYLPSAWIPCEDCQGDRFTDEVLAAEGLFGDRRLNIAQFLSLSVAEAAPLLLESMRSTGDNAPRCHQTAVVVSESSLKSARSILQALLDVGLGYLPLGQPSPSLSGGEAQRVKLARSLGKRSLAGQLLILDEPSTGLHPQDVAGLLVVLQRLVHSGATLVVVEHNTDIIRAADWIIDLGPGAGPEGGRLLFAGKPEGLWSMSESQTAQALLAEDRLKPGQFISGDDNLCSRHQSKDKDFIELCGASAHNLQNVTVRFPKAALTVVTGVSGSGKSSLVSDVLESEARRRFLESLSMYERQSTREGPEAPVEAVSGLGVAVTIGTERSMFQRRATVGTATELAHHLGVLLADLGQRPCLECGAEMVRGMHWTCPNCGSTATLAEPRHFNPAIYAAACLKCNGVGTLQHPIPEKLIIHPEKPLCAGAMYSPGFFPQGYLGKPFNGGYDVVHALAARYLFDPFKTPWNEMSPEARQAFLYGDPEPLNVHYVSRTGRERWVEQRFGGFFSWVGDWDVGGTYHEARPCPDCQGCGLRTEFASVRLAGENWKSLSEMTLVSLEPVLREVGLSASPEQLQRSPHGRFVSTFTANSLVAAQKRTQFLIRTGLGYLDLRRQTASLSAGEAQRVRLAGLLGSEMTSLTVLLDEPTRGLHPGEVKALVEALQELSWAGNTVILVEHDLDVMRAADHVIDMGPGAGIAGGKVVAQGTPREVACSDSLTGRWLRGDRSAGGHAEHELRLPERWMEIHGARANNLRGEIIRFPLQRLVGVCGVSGSGKSTLVIDTLGRALAPKKQTTSVAYEPVQPGEHDRIVGAPGRVILVDQARRGVHSPADFLDLSAPLQRIYAESEPAAALGLDESAFSRRCSACGGSGVLKVEMGFLPDIFSSCDLCAGTGFRAEAWDVAVNGVTMPELFTKTIEEVAGLFGSDERMGTSERMSTSEQLSRPLQMACQVGLGYLALRQPGHALSGGEVQRLKIAKELCKKARNGHPEAETLYILDEPTVGQHAEDVMRLVGVLHGLVQAGHSVLVVEHNPLLLAGCDWLVELGPGGGPEGGWLVAQGTPWTVAQANTPTAPYLREILEARG